MGSGLGDKAGKGKLGFQGQRGPELRDRVKGWGLQVRAEAAPGRVQEKRV